MKKPGVKTPGFQPKTKLSYENSTRIKIKKEK